MARNRGANGTALVSDQDARRLIGAHPRYAAFEDYGDADGFRKLIARSRRADPDQG
jgi:hypothetical protein